MWGCEADAPVPIVFDGRETRRCPRRPLLDSPGVLWPLFEAYAWRERGYLPAAGSWLDQDARFVQACAVIDVANHDADEHERSEREKAEERDRRRQARAGAGQHPARRFR